MELLAQGMYESYAEALTPCVLCLMSRENVKTLLLGEPRIALRITEILSQRLIESERRMSDFVFKNLSQRVAVLLLRHTQQPDAQLASEGGHELHYTHDQIAGMVGTNRETVTKILNEFRAAGWIGLRRGKVVLFDLQALRKLSGN
jgi:CRP/FNR family cyclic AMP-dependent transcriptional regulator